ncbi:MAG: hypothetical protein RL653_1285 [Pseudomonadota bacterium]|jgi:hypothetical protein
MLRKTPPRGTTTKRAPARRRRNGAGRPVELPARVLHYKVAELSTVDEQSLERVVNQHAAAGWALDGVQFAMREQSKRPAMAFVFFTREGPPAEESPGREQDEARAHLSRLAEPGAPAAALPVSAYERLRQLAEDDDGGGST